LAKVLCPSAWPGDETDRLLFGDRELTTLAKLVGVNVSAALAEFREHKVNVK